MHIYQVGKVVYVKNFLAFVEISNYEGKLEKSELLKAKLFLRILAFLFLGHLHTLLKNSAPKEKSSSMSFFVSFYIHGNKMTSNF